MKHHLFMYNIIDNPFCQACGVCFETIEHFWFVCTSYSTFRVTLLSNLSTIYNTSDNRPSCISQPAQDRDNIMRLITHGVNIVHANINTVSLDIIVLM